MAGARTHQLARGVAYALTVPPTLVFTCPGDKATIVKWLGVTNNAGTPIATPMDVFLSVGPGAGRSRCFSLGYQGDIIDPQNSAIQGTMSGFCYIVLEPLDELWIGSVQGGNYDFLISGAELNY